MPDEPAEPGVGARGSSTSVSARAPAAAPASQVARSANPRLISNGACATGRPICQVSSAPMASARSTIHGTRRSTTAIRSSSGVLRQARWDVDGPGQPASTLGRAGDNSLGDDRAVDGTDRALDADRIHHSGVT